MPPPKHHFFNVRSPPGTSVDEVIDAVEALVTVNEIYSVQHLGAFDFQVGINSAPAVHKLLEVGGLRLGNQAVALVPVARQVASVTCMYLPSYISDNEVAESLKIYGTTLKIEEARYKDRPSIRTGTRYLKMNMKHDNPLPNFARVSGHRATFEYRGVRRLCRRCSQEGHYKAQCETPFCRRCGIFGHPEETCSLACRRCGGAHASVDCTARKSYSMAAMEVDDFPPLGRAPEAERTQRKFTPLKAAPRSLQRSCNGREGAEHGPTSQDLVPRTEPQGPQDTDGIKTPSQHDSVQPESGAAAASRGGGSTRKGAQDGDSGHTPSQEGVRQQSIGPTPGSSRADTEQRKDADGSSSQWWDKTGDEDGQEVTTGPRAKTETRRSSVSIEQSGQEAGGEEDAQAQDQLPRTEPVTQQQAAVLLVTRSSPKGRRERGDRRGARRGSEASTDATTLLETETSSTSSSDEPSALVIDEEAPESPRGESSDDLRRRDSRPGDSRAAHSDVRQQPEPLGHGSTVTPSVSAEHGTERPHGSAKKPRRDDSGERRLDWSATEWTDLTPGRRDSEPGSVDAMDADDSDFY
ncbi:uncharacterized protein [Dermacentor andersoni]|uniref:uncharacterized protein n=1 Tax=Dermacentor andersoni TaxID=34620 RepID=UPI003B3A4303